MKKKILIKIFNSKTRGFIKRNKIHDAQSRKLNFNKYLGGGGLFLVIIIEKSLKKYI